jgi:hypothetical protein
MRRPKKVTDTLGYNLRPQKGAPNGGFVLEIGEMPVCLEMRPV